MTAILDTTQWTWSIPDASPYQPFPRSFAAASVVNGSKMVYGFGKQKVAAAYDHYALLTPAGL